MNLFFISIIVGCMHLFQSFLVQSRNDYKFHWKPNEMNEIIENNDLKSKRKTSNNHINEILFCFVFFYFGFSFHNSFIELK